MAAERDLGVRLGRTIDDQLGVDVEPKTFGRRAGSATERTAGAGDAGTGNAKRRDGRSDIVREPAADEFGDFERTHPDMASLVNADDLGERLLLLRRPCPGRTGHRSEEHTSELQSL